MTRSRRHYSTGNKAAIISEDLDLFSGKNFGFDYDFGTNNMKKDCLAVSLLAFVLYINSFSADFAYDDSRAVVRNPDVVGETSIWQTFNNDFWGLAMTYNGSHKSYRPLCTLTFRLNHLLDGLDPTGYHVVNVLLHVIVTVLFWRFVVALTGRRSTGLLSSLLFAAHPVHTEAVTGVVGRADLLAACFFLLTLYAYRQYALARDRGQGSTVGRMLAVVVVTGLLAGCGMLCKEHGVTVLMVCVVYDLVVHSHVSLSSIFSQMRQWSLWEGPLCVAVAGYVLLWLRLSLMGNSPPEFAPADNPAADSESRLTRLLTFAYLPVFNVWLLLCPSSLSFDWSMDAIPLVETTDDLRNVATFAFYAVLAAAALTLLGRLGSSAAGAVLAGHCNGHTTNSMSASQHMNGHSTHAAMWSKQPESTCNAAPQCNRTETVVLGCALAVLPFLPATNLFFYVGFVVAERVLYISSMGYCLLVGEGLRLLWTRAGSRRHRAALAILALTLLVVMSARTVRRNVDWQTEERLYHSGVATNPAKALGNLANIYKGQGRVREAEVAYRQALKKRNNMADVHYNLGVLLQDQKRYKESIESYQAAIQCRSRMTMAYLNLGMVYTALGMKAEAEKVYLQCSVLDYSTFKDPRSHEQTQISALYNLGRLYADQGKFKEAVEVYHRAIDRRPSHYPGQSLFNMLGEAYMKLNMQDKAKHWYSESLKAKPDHLPAHLTMGKLYHAQGQLKLAEEWFIKAIKLAPNDTSALSHYGLFLGETGRTAESAEQYLKAAIIAPEDIDVTLNTANALREAKRNAEAEVYYRRAATLRPSDPTTHMNLGAMLHVNGKLTEAEQSYLTALRLKPNDSTTLDNLKKLRSLLTG